MTNIDKAKIVGITLTIECSVCGAYFSTTLNHREDSCICAGCKSKLQIPGAWVETPEPEGQITRFISAQYPQQSIVFIEGQGWQVLSELVEMKSRPTTLICSPPRERTKCTCICRCDKEMYQDDFCEDCWYPNKLDQQRNAISESHK